MSEHIVEIRHNITDPDDRVGFTTFLHDLYSNIGMVPVYRYSQYDAPLLKGEIGRIYGCRIVVNQSPVEIGPPPENQVNCTHRNARSDTFSQAICPECFELVPT